MTRFLTICMALAVSGTTVFAQYMNILDDGTNQSVNSTWITTNAVIVGSTTSSNYLDTVSNGGIKAPGMIIGNSAVASSNTARLSSSSSQWNISGDIQVGNGGSNNSLLINNGAVAVSDNGQVGVSNAANNNVVSVSGQGAKFGSYWGITNTLTIGAAGNTNNQVNVGEFGFISTSNLVIHADNAFNINADGTLRIKGGFDRNTLSNLTWNTGGDLIVGGSLTGLDNMAGTNQTLTIDGGTWENSGVNSTVGVDGAGNGLIVENGGQVDNVSGIIGSTTNAIGNGVLVTGTNSVWNNSGDLTVGKNGSSNKLRIEDGGTVNNKDAFVGRSTGGLNNKAEVFGKDSRWINDGVLTVGATNTSGNSVTVSAGGTIEAKELKILSGNTFNLEADGTLAITDYFNASMSNFNWDAGTVSAGGVLEGLETNSEGTILKDEKSVVLNSGSHMTTNDLVVGFEGSDSSFAVTNGGSAENANGYIGWGSDASRNSALVSDGGVWTNNGNLYVGFYGDSTNLMTAGTGNALTVTNNGSVFVGGAATNLVGISIASNATLAVSASSSVVTEGLYIDANGDFNLDGALQVTGDFDANQNGFNWNDAATLTVNSSLTYTNDIGGSNKTLNVAGIAASWNAGTNLLVNGVDSTLNILDGATVTAMNTTVGAGSNDVKNTVNVSGDVTKLNGGTQFTVGFLGSGNSLNITNGGEVANTHGYIGMSSDGNTVSVSGSNSVWSNSGNLYVGSDGTNNTLKVSDGATVESDHGFIGRYVGADGNTATVSGHGSVWTNYADLSIGLQGATNSLSITGGGLVHNENGYIGNSNTAMANAVMVSGSNSIWRNTGDLYIGNEGSGNTLDIKSAGLVLSDNGFIGAASSSSGNVVTVNDSKWTNSGNLTVGQNGSGNQLTVENGGRVDSVNGIIGSGATATENEVTVTGKDSLWNNTGNLVIGASGSANELNILGGGVVSNITGTVGANGGASNNFVSVSGDGSAWVNSGTLSVGSNVSSNNSAIVYGGARITAADVDVYVGNTLSISNQGTLAITGSFDLNAKQSTLDWQVGGEIAIEGDLVNTTEFDGDELILSIDGGTWTNAVDQRVIGKDGSDNQFNIINGGYVLNTNAIVGAGTNTSGTAALVSGTGSIWENTDTLYIGAVSNSGNRVTVKDSGTVKAGDLSIAEGNSFVLADGGTLRMTGTNFNYSAQTNLDWMAGGNLAVEGRLTGLDETETIVQGMTNAATFIDAGHVITIGGPAGRLSGSTNLIVGFEDSNSGLIINDGGKVDNANGYIGWGSGSQANFVQVTGADSVWTNRENLYIGGYPTTNGWAQAGTSGLRNSLTVEDEAWVLVGEVTTADLGSASGGVAVASTTGAELQIGWGDLTTDDLYVGTGSGLTGSVRVRDTGVVRLDNLVIDPGASNKFWLAGSLIATNGFNAGMTGFEWEDEGRITVQSGELTGISRIEGTNRAVTLNSANWITPGILDIGAYGSGNKLTVTGDSQLTSSGAFIGNSNAANSLISLSGSNVVWNNDGDLTVGNDGSGNSLLLSDGAEFYNMGDAFIGVTSNAFGNSVTVSGSNTLWNNTGDLFVGKSGSNSTLTVSGLARVDVGGNLNVKNSSTLSLSSTNSEISVANDLNVVDSKVTGSGMITFGAADSALSISGTNSTIDEGIQFVGGGSGSIDVMNATLVLNAARTNQFTGFSALDLTDSTLQAGGTIEKDTFGTISMNGGTLNLTDHFTIEGEMVATGKPLLKMTAEEHSLNLKNTAPFDLSDLKAVIKVNGGQDVQDFTPTIITAENGLTPFDDGDLTFDERYLLYGFEPVYTANEVSIKAVAATDGEISSTLAMAGSEGIRAGFNGMKSAVFTRTKQMRRNVVATAHSIPQEAFLLSNTNGPTGAMGPGDQNTIFDMHVWLQYFNGQGESDAYGLSDGFSLNNNGTTIGADRLFGDSLIAGFNYTYARSDARSTNRDTVGTETYWIGGYAEWVSPGGIYVDTMAAYGSSDYNSRRIAENYVGHAKYDGNDFGGYLDVGQYYHYKNMALSPYIGLHALTAHTDNYVEKEQDENLLYVDERRRSWLESAVGLKARHRFDTRKGRIQTTGYAEWLHDFLQQDVDSQLSVGGLGPIDTARISPDADIFGMGAGLSWIYTDYLEFGIGYNGRFSDHYEEHTGSIMIDVRF